MKKLKPNNIKSSMNMSFYLPDKKYWYQRWKIKRNINSLLKLLLEMPNIVLTIEKKQDEIVIFTKISKSAVEKIVAFLEKTPCWDEYEGEKVKQIKWH